MNKIVILTDTHHGARNDSQLFLNYFMKFYDEVFFPQISGIDNVFHLGDVWDRRKFINYKTLDTIKQRVFNKFGPHNLHIITGNHDTYYKSTNEVNSPELLMGDYNFNIYSKPQEVTIEGLKILVLPWINDDNREYTMSMIERTDAKVCFAHLELAGFQFMKGITSHEGMNPDIFKKFDLVLSGHYHHKSKEGNIQYLGCPYEITFGDYGDPKGFHIFDTKTLDLTFIENPYKMFHKLWYDDSEGSQEVPKGLKDTYIRVITKNKTNAFWFDQYITKIYEQNPASVAIIEDVLQLNIKDDDSLVDQAADTLTILKNYIDNTQTNEDDKEKLNVLLQDIYREALELQIGSGE